MSDNNLKFERNGAELTVELLDKLQASTNDQNVLISPISIQTCMALAYAGANGCTANEIATALKFASNNPSEVAEAFQRVLEKYHDSKLVKIANKVYVQEGQTIKPEYAAITRERYHAEAESVNFGENVEAAKNINSWVANKTAGKISELIQAASLNSHTRLVLLNALHFKGEWQEQFDADDTAEDDFWLNENDSVQVPFMRVQSDFHHSYLTDLNCQALEMPYKDSDLSMFVLLPDQRDGLKDLVENLKGVNLLDLDKELHVHPSMIVKFPKFKISYSVELSDILQEVRHKHLGMPQKLFCKVNTCYGS